MSAGVGSVSTFVGNGKSGCVDGVGSEAQLSYPRNICQLSDASLLVTQMGGHSHVRRIHYESSKDGSNGSSVTVSSPKAYQFELPHGICANPLKPNSFFVGDKSAVRYCEYDTENGGSCGLKISLIAGDEKEFGSRNATQALDIRFNGIQGLICTKDGNTLYVSDLMNDRIQVICLKSRAVESISVNAKNGSGRRMSFPRGITFDRSTKYKPETILFVAASSGIFRIDLETKHISTLNLIFHHPFSPTGIVSTPSGLLIVTCSSTASMYLIDPNTGQATRLAGSGEPIGFADGPALTAAKFCGIDGLVVIDSEQCAYVCDDSNHRIRRVPLLPHLFEPVVVPVVPEVPVVSVVSPADAIVHGNNECKCHGNPEIVAGTVSGAGTTIPLVATRKNGEPRTVTKSTKSADPPSFFHRYGCAISIGVVIVGVSALAVTRFGLFTRPTETPKTTG